MSPHLGSTARRTHRKTRTGCGTCKRRKIKCDEGRPSCRNCATHAVPCDFLAPTPPPPESSPGTTTSLSSASAPLNLVDLELLHNFTASTYATLTDKAELRSLYKSVVVRRAVRCEFVMRALLAVSAVHTAQHRSANERDAYISHATHYHDIASRHAAACMTSHLLHENRENLWIFSILTIYVGLGKPRSHPTALGQMGENALPEWVFLVNGVRQFFLLLQSSFSGEQPYTGSLAPLINNGTESWIEAHKPENQQPDILLELGRRVEASAAVRDDPHLLGIYQEAISELVCALSLVFSSRRPSPNGSPSLDIVDAFLWHFQVADTFIPLVQQEKQEALAIFAHSLIVLSAVGGQKWLHGWDVYLLSRVWALLDEEHRPWIEWPIEEIGWVPPSS